jgi:hypothetical protein
MPNVQFPCDEHPMNRMRDEHPVRKLLIWYALGIRLAHEQSVNLHSCCVHDTCKRRRMVQHRKGCEEVRFYLCQMTYRLLCVIIEEPIKVTPLWCVD